MKRAKRSPDVVISDHSIVRYVERVIGIDVDWLKNNILPENLRAGVKSLGDGRYPVNEHVIVVRDNTVVTVLAEGYPDDS